MTYDVAAVVEDLSTIQQRTSVPVLIPNFMEGYTIGDVKDIRRAALLIEGRSVLHRWTDLKMRMHPHIELVPGTHYSVRTGQDLRLRKITGDAILGLVQQLAPSATVAAVEGDLVRIRSIQGRHDVPHDG